ncbi:MAG: hypothetical protein IJ484_06880, partial [Oscillospiraceae bacterium]|nr:hypothetical protein [Oscillospiraceae bacterium]
MLERTMQRLLDGRRAGLWAVGLQLAAGAAGFVLAGGQVLGGMYPFGLALVMGLERGLTPAAALGAMLGSLVRLEPLA